ncbi:copia protein [Tanacetum coccineum]|uniref:Copia protein n=1 Tax=Tanacetum coccineum TaxID=301880 RepID=A0ABQ5F9W0_9ASTR
MTIIGTKWVFRNKLDENGIVSRNKARLVAQGYNQQEGIDYDETYAPVARLESIRILLAYACALDFKLFQMDVKSAFLNGFINEEVYMAQPPGFIDFENRIMFINLRELYMVSNKHPKLEMLKKFGLEDSKPMKTPMSSDTKLTKDEECESVDSTKYRGMIEQTALAISTAEAEYVSARKACQQALWMKQAPIDYNLRLDDVPIMCDNKGAIDFRKNPVQHSGTKHIEIRHHFLHDNSENFNLAFFIAKRMEFITKEARLILSYGILLTHLFKYVMSESHELFNESYVLYGRVMYPLSSQQERKTRKDCDTKRGRHSTSSSSSFDQPSSSHLNDDNDDGNGEGTSRASTPSPTRFVNSLINEVPRVFKNPPNVKPDIE